MRCVETFGMMLPDNDNQGARHTLADPSPTTGGPPRSLPVVPLIPNFEPTCCRSLAARSAPCSQRSLGTSLSLIGDQRYYGEASGGLRRDCRRISGNGPGSWRWVGGEELAFLGSQPGPEVSTENAANGKGARPNRSLGIDSTDGHLSSGPEGGGRGRRRQESDSRGYVRWPHSAQRGCPGIEHSRVQGQPGALRTTATQYLICAHEKAACGFAIVIRTFPCDAV